LTCWFDQSALPEPAVRNNTGTKQQKRGWTMNAAHTATPMRASGTRVYLPNLAGGFDLRECPNAEELAAFIVRACNAHDDLVRRASDVLEGLEGLVLPGAMPVRVEKLRAALEKAGAA
jgi:hypothetical protein